MTIEAIDHPLVHHKMALLRQAKLSTREFRQLSNEIAALLAYKATEPLPLESYSFSGWNGQMNGQQIAGKKLTVVPILRAGVGMLDGVLSMIPAAKISVIGLYRNEETLEPVPYFDRIVSDMENRSAIIIDPMLATAGSMIATVQLLKEAGCTDIKALVLVAAPEGLANMEKTHPDVRIYCAAIDSHLNDQGYIIPGLGDAGDKIFGTK